MKRITINEITQTEIIGPTKKLKTKIKKNYIIDNTEFENILYNKAIKNNNKIILNTKYIKSKNGKHTIKSTKTGNEKIIKSEKIIGIDGPNSRVAKQNKIKPVTKTLTGLQVRMKLKDQENLIKFFPHIGEYAWFVPEEENFARVGIATTNKHSQSKASLRFGQSPNNPQQLLNTFLKRFKGKIIEQQSGIIPLHRPFRKTSNKKCVLLGDAAGHTKNTTGGGIVLGLKAVENYIAQKQSKTAPYKDLNKELYIHFLVHNAIKTANKSEWDSIIKNMTNSTVLSQNNRDDLWAWAPKLIRQPKIARFCTKKLFSGQLSLR